MVDVRLVSGARLLVERCLMLIWNDRPDRAPAFIVQTQAGQRGVWFKYDEVESANVLPEPETGGTEQ